ncbi:MAG: bifunctional UDP-3-O-[3-hydroxymyristoyl] N-acetylglucosamine deacetylase/3-hydroxyacyl-ACP dehydratase [Prevotellaceae bacterium]|nr:bifunctional UDP-3-O-[3-hydroxymyristoyl] N-acetylglucosamine deacetylase/3-hydroxyacyl-ACP dehydratase [Prevotellaceae bacterium]
MTQQKQQTIGNEVILKGKGLHTGLDVEMTICPAEPNHGIKFQRIDLEEQPVIDAIADYVTDTSRGTTIENKNVRVSTIEHIMAALFGLGIDNALIKLNAPEVPIMDGSAKIHVEELLKAGIVEQDADRWYFEIKEKLVYKNDDGTEIVVLPDSKFSVDVTVDFKSKVLGNQYARLTSIDEFAAEIAPCRTFVFFHELEILFKRNLIKGGDMENAIVIVENDVPQEDLDRIAGLFNKKSVERVKEGYLNNLKLRFLNEPARHKMLDLIGDLSLVGYPVTGKIYANKPGHSSNTEMAKILRKAAKKALTKPSAPKYDPREEPLFDIKAIRKMLPHRPPFLLVDKILTRDETTIVGIKNVTINEPFFVGHFPEEPVMPGVLIIEAMAQCGGLLVLGNVSDPELYSTYFLKIDKVKFRGKVVPGDTLIFKLILTEPIRRGIVIMSAQAFVGENLVAEGEMTAQVIKNK